MPVHDADIVAIFEEIADLLEIQGATTFRIRVYRNAARLLAALRKLLSRTIRSCSRQPLAVSGCSAVMIKMLRPG